MYSFLPSFQQRDYIIVIYAVGMNEMICRIETTGHDQEDSTKIKLVPLYHKLYAVLSDVQ